jgi:ribonuclease HII
MLSEPRREELAPVAASWALGSAVGLASAAEVDAFGIMIALGLAGFRALTVLDPSGTLRRESVVLLDGTHDWLSPALETRTAVRVRAKADRDCASVAAASVIAKVHRDRMMIEWDADHPPYGWRGNKGYASSGHLAAIEQHGATDLHRRTWLRSDTALPGLALGSPDEQPLGSALGPELGTQLRDSA